MIKLVSALFFAILLGFCARPCPSDINLGSLALQPSSVSFLPVGQRVQEMTFKNTSGATLLFRNANPRWDTPLQNNAETLCQRGDFLDKTAQTAYYNTENYNLQYKSTDNNYTLDVHLYMQNAGTYGSRTDTAFYEQFSVGGQKLSNPIGVGFMHKISSDRGNASKLPANLIADTDNGRFVADTLLGQKQLSNVWVANAGGGQGLFVYYSQVLGIEAFVVDGVVWVRL